MLSSSENLNPSHSSVDFRCGQLLSAGTASASSRKNTAAGSSDTCCSRRSQLSSASINHYDSSTKLYRDVYQAHPAKEIHGDSCGRKGLGETTQCVAQGGSTAAQSSRNRPFPKDCVLFPSQNRASAINAHGSSPTSFTEYS